MAWKHIVIMQTKEGKGIIKEVMLKDIFDEEYRLKGAKFEIPAGHDVMIAIKKSPKAVVKKTVKKKAKK